MLEELKAGSRVVGAKQTRRALKDGRAKRVYMAKDADPRLLQPLVQEAVRQRVPIIQVDTMRQLGEACGISVGAEMCIRDSHDRVADGAGDGGDRGPLARCV